MTTAGIAAITAITGTTGDTGGTTETTIITITIITTTTGILSPHPEALIPPDSSPQSPVCLTGRRGFLHFCVFELLIT